MIESVSSPGSASVEASSSSFAAPMSSVDAVALSGTPSPTPQPTSAAKPSAPAAPPQPATRLYVEHVAPAIYVYRIVDVASGRVIAELPRDRISDLDLSATYAPGDLTSTSA